MLLNYAKPLLDAIQAALPDYNIKNWNTQTNIVNKIITYYMSIRNNKKYNTAAFSGGMVLDIWDNNLRDLAEAEEIAYSVLQNYSDSFENYIIYVDNIATSDFKIEKDTRLYRKNITINYTVIIYKGEERINVVANQIAAYSQFVFINNNKVLGCGDNQNSQLGTGSTAKYIYTPTAMALPDAEKPISVDVSDYVTCVLTESGNVYTCGKNEYGILGVGSTDTALKRYTPQLILQNIKQIAVGNTCIHALDKNGDVWTWGYTCLADGTTYKCIFTPTKLTLPAEINEKIAYVSYTLIVTEKGSVWAWGAKERWIANSKERALYPEKLNIQGVKKAINYNNSIIYLMQDGTLCSSGNNTSGQLGNGNNINSNITNVLFVKDAKDIELGFSHAMAIDKNGDVWTWGNNYCGKLGDGTTNDRNYPLKIEGLKNIVSIAGGLGSSYFMDKNGILYGCGGDGGGGLGYYSSTSSNITTPIVVYPK